MVKNPGTEIRTHRVRPLNPPRAVTVETVHGRPVALTDKRGERVEITAIEEEWSIDDEWWRDRLQRHYFRVCLPHGAIRTIFLDGESRRWFEQSY